MSQTLLAMYANVTTSSDAAASIIIPEDGRIEGIYFAHSATLNADGEDSVFEVGFTATNNITTNDVRSVLLVGRARMGLLTSGAATVSSNQFVPFDVDVFSGEKVYLHVSGSSGVVTGLNIIIHFRANSRRTRRTSRR